jgi:hypothetical protein
MGPDTGSKKIESEPSAFGSCPKMNPTLMGHAGSRTEHLIYLCI